MAGIEAASEIVPIIAGGGAVQAGIALLQRGSIRTADVHVDAQMRGFFFSSEFYSPALDCS
jgi:hypothetical protein